MIDRAINDTGKRLLQIRSEAAALQALIEGKETRLNELYTEFNDTDFKLAAHGELTGNTFLDYALSWSHPPFDFQRLYVDLVRLDERVRATKEGTACMYENRWILHVGHLSQPALEIDFLDSDDFDCLPALRLTGLVPVARRQQGRLYTVNKAVEAIELSHFLVPSSSGSYDKLFIGEHEVRKGLSDMASVDPSHYSDVKMYQKRMRDIAKIGKLVLS